MQLQFKSILYWRRYGRFFVYVPLSIFISDTHNSRFFENQDICTVNGKSLLKHFHLNIDYFVFEIIKINSRVHKLSSLKCPLSKELSLSDMFFFGDFVSLLAIDPSACFSDVPKVKE